MRDDDDSQAELLVDVSDEMQDRLRRLRVKRARRLVGQEHLRIGRERPRDADALLLPARELRRVLLRLVGESDEREERLDLRADLRLVRAGKAQGEGDVVVDGRRRQQVEVLEDHADALALFAKLRLTERGQILAVNDDLALRRPLQHVDAANQGRLARARKADDAIDLAALDFEVDAFERRDLARRALVAFLDGSKPYHAHKITSL